ncbi:MAG: hypothetical protein ACLRWA_06245 [Lachnospira sp.]
MDRMFSKAEYIVTSTFHGLMIGLNYKKQIKFCQVDFVKNRSEFLVNELGIPNFGKCYEEELNYLAIEPRLELLKKESIKNVKTDIGNLNMMGGNYKMQTLKNSIHYVAASKDEEILKK